MNVTVTIPTLETEHLTLRAPRLGATLDARQTEIANAPGGEFYSDDPADRDDPIVNIWRHHKGALI